MVKIKEVQVTANYAWSPAGNHPVYIAAGTAAQQLDATFSSNAKLELYAIDMTESSMVAKCAGNVEVENRFQKVVWGATYPDSPQANGVIVCGTDKGGIEIYNPDKIIAEEEDCIVLTTSNHTGPVRALDFNSFQKNLFASGASDSEIFIWDLKNPGNPMTPGKKTQPTSAISSVAWNKQVQHILASTSTLTSGPCCVVWDLRKNEPIIKVQDPAGRMQCSDVAWHPEVATQLVLASEDDHAPVVQLWDLRFATSPMKVLEKHERGVVSVSWCPRDPDLLLTCGKDNQVYCWNPNTSPPEVVHELETHAQWCFDVQWCPRNPNVVSTGSFDGHISIHSLMGGGMSIEEETADEKQRNVVAEAFGSGAFPSDAQQQHAPSTKKKVSVPLKKPPKWMRKPCGATFVFGGKLITFEDVPPSEGQQKQSVRRTVNINQVVTEFKLLERSQQLRQALSTDTQCSEYCQQKSASAKTDFEENFWNFLKVNFEPEPRKQYLQLLGYNSAELKKRFNSMLGVKAINGDLSSQVDNLSVSSKGEASESSLNNSSSTNGLDAFDAIVAANDASPEQVKPSNDKPMLIPVADNENHLTVAEHGRGRRRSTLGLLAEDLDSLISQALLIGDYDTAVELCLHGGRMADAIVLAIAGGSALLEKTQKRYFASSESKISRLLSSIVTKDWNDIVRSCDLDNWKEALASLLTYATSDDLVRYCDELGERLENNDKTRVHACLCYVCSGNIDRLVSCWGKIQPASDAKDTEAIQDLVEKVMVLLRIAGAGNQGNVPLGDAASDKLAEYASTLAAQGQLNAAMEILPGSANKQAIQILRDRLFHSQGDDIAGRQPPPFPFTREGVRSEQRPAAQVQPQRHNRGMYSPQQTSQTYSPQPISAIQPIQSYSPSVRQQPVPGRQRANPYASNQPAQISQYSAAQQPPANIFTPQSMAPVPQSMAQPITSTMYQPYSALPSRTPVSNGPTAMPPQGPNPPLPPSPDAYGEGVKHNVGGWNDPPVLDPNRIPKKKKTNLVPPDPSSYFVPGVSSLPMLNPKQSENLTPKALPGHLPQIGHNHTVYVQDTKSTEDGSQSFMSRMVNLMVPKSPTSKVESETMAETDHNPALVEPSPQPFLPDALNIMTPTQPAQAPPGPMHPGIHPGAPMHPGVHQGAPMQPGMHMPPGPMQPGLMRPAPSMNAGGPPGAMLGVVNQQSPLQQQQANSSPAMMQNIQPNRTSSPSVPTGALKDVPKAPIPTEHLILQTQFDELVKKCQANASNPQMKRKLDECTRRLEFLYDKLRANSLAPNIIGGLHQMAQSVGSRDYATGLRHHTQIVSHSNFSEISAFMPGLKSMLQIAGQLRI